MASVIIIIIIMIEQLVIVDKQRMYSNDNGKGEVGAGCSIYWEFDN